MESSKQFSRGFDQVNIRPIDKFQTTSHLFNPKDLEMGKHQVVGSCNEYSMQERWDTETPIFRDIILSHLKNTDEIILDYGCGVGRLAKELIDSNEKIKVIGVDTSPGMLQVAKEYVNSDRFIPMQPKDFDEKVDFAYCVYVLQHIPPQFLDNAIDQLCNATKDKLLLVNSVARMAATEQGFNNDGIDVLEKVSKYFKKINWAIPAEVILNDRLMQTMFMGRSVSSGGNTFHYSVIFSKQ